MLPGDCEEDHYEPTEEERQEIEDILNKEASEHKEEFEEDNKAFKPPIKERKFFTFNSESHFAGWLKIHGIKW